MLSPEGHISSPYHLPGKIIGEGGRNFGNWEKIISDQKILVWNECLRLYFQVHLLELPLLRRQLLRLEYWRQPVIIRERTFPLSRCGVLRIMRLNLLCSIFPSFYELCSGYKFCKMSNWNLSKRNEILKFSPQSSISWNGKLLLCFELNK